MDELARLFSNVEASKSRWCSPNHLIRQIRELNRSAVFFLVDLDHERDKTRSVNEESDLMIESGL